jgi:tRNA 2-thiouridine synthesizing protein D
VQAGHRIVRIFFFHDGVQCGNQLLIPPAGQQPMSAQWSEFAQRNQIDLVVCVASALKRGVLDHSEAQRYDKAANLQSGFDLSGLGQWIEACALADRVVTFGA